LIPAIANSLEDVKPTEGLIELDGVIAFSPSETLIGRWKVNVMTHGSRFFFFRSTCCYGAIKFIAAQGATVQNANLGRSELLREDARAKT
jgi:hypothetical protein